MLDINWIRNSFKEI